MNTPLLLSLFLITGLAVPSRTFAQWNEFEDPGYGETTQYSEWDHFVTTNNATPDVTGNNGTVSETTGAGFPSTTLNIYSFSLDMDFTVTGTSTNDLGEVTLQFAIWGSASSLKNPAVLYSNGSIIPKTPDSSATVSVGHVFIEFLGTTVPVTRFSYTWDLSGLETTAYEIDFSLNVHTTLDRVRLDTTTEGATHPPPVEPIHETDLDTVFASGGFSLSFPSVVGLYYQVKWTDDLANAGDIETWNDLGTAILGTGSTIDLSDPNSIESDSRFYSVVVSNTLP